jgi:hypothetical protein
MSKSLLFFVFSGVVLAQSMTVDQRMNNLSDKSDALGQIVTVLGAKPNLDLEDIMPVLEEMNIAFIELAHLTIDTIDDPVKTKRLDSIGKRLVILVKEINSLDKKVSKKSRKPLRLARFLF